jgi:hypothetical protein
MKRENSSHVWERAQEIARELREGAIPVDCGTVKVLKSRKEVMAGWKAIGDALLRERYRELAEQVRRFAEYMPPPETEKGWLMRQLLERIRGGINSRGNLSISR